MTDPVAPPPGSPDAPSPPEGGVSRHTIVLLTSIGGGLLAASLFLAAALPPGGPLLAVVVLGFAGGLALFVGALLGAMSRRFSSGARAGFGVGAFLAFVMVMLLLVAGPAVATETSPVCGAIVAGPGLFALRSFTLLRDAA